MLGRSATTGVSKERVANQEHNGGEHGMSGIGVWEIGAPDEVLDQNLSLQAAIDT